MKHIKAKKAKHEVTPRDLLILEKVKNLDNINNFINQFWYKDTKEYVQLMVAKEEFPDIFQSCKNNFEEKLETFMNEVNKQYKELCVQMYLRGYEEGHKSENVVKDFLKSLI